MPGVGAQKELIWFHRALAGSERVYYKTARLAVPLSGFLSCYVVCLTPVFSHSAIAVITSSSRGPHQSSTNTILSNL